jgi:hypothetical protein
MEEKEEKKEKKEYITPEINKHKALAIMSGSGDDSDPCYYQSKTIGTTYYH